MFGGDSRDPFGNHLHNMHSQMRAMDNMMNTMMGDAFTMLDGFGRNMNQNRHPMLTNSHPLDDMMLSPFGGFGGMMNPFGGFGGPPMFGGMGIVPQMHNLHERALNDPNSMLFSQSTMVSYDETGRPKVVQESTRKAGNAKETRRAVRDDGEELVSIGHTIGDKSHIIEKKKDKTGRTQQQQRFVNLAEDEAEKFNKEFKTQAKDFLHGNGLYRPSTNQYSLENGGGKSNGSSRRNGGGGKSVYYSSSGNGTAAPIVTIPDDDDEQGSSYGHGQRYGGREHGEYTRNGGGPIIREITDDDEDDSAHSKRRKGLFGKFHG